MRSYERADCALSVDRALCSTAAGGIEASYSGIFGGAAENGQVPQMDINRAITLLCRNPAEKPLVIGTFRV